MQSRGVALGDEHRILRSLQLLRRHPRQRLGHDRPNQELEERERGDDDEDFFYCFAHRYTIVAVTPGGSAKGAGPLQVAVTEYVAGVIDVTATLVQPSASRTGLRPVTAAAAFN